MGFKRFSVLVVTRTVFIMLTLVLLSVLFSYDGYHASTFVVFLLLCFLAFELNTFVSKTNSELVRFLDAVKHADFSQRFALDAQGSGFEQLGRVFSDILNRIQDSQTEQETQMRHLKAIIEHVPVPLLSIQDDASITLWNFSARKLFGIHRVTQLPDLQQFGDTFYQQIKTLKPGQKTLVDFDIDGMTYQLSLSATLLTSSSRQECLVSMQDIQNELEFAQMSAWQDLVRVLTHEIMNSITPVSSLAKTAVDLVDDTKVMVNKKQDISEELEALSDAVGTVSRRSDSLMNFVSSYRKLTRLPPINRTQIQIDELFKMAIAIGLQDQCNIEVLVKIQIEPNELSVFADKDMLEQILINLIRNAQQALEQVANPMLQLNAKINPRGHIVITISDNGSGVDPQITDKIFVPFFTTKRDGSGVGLALSRQVMIAHGGMIKYKPSQYGGAEFSLTF